MANTLKKLGVVTYTPAVPPTPAKPGYCIVEGIAPEDADRLVGRHDSDSSGSVAGTQLPPWASTSHDDPDDPDQLSVTFRHDQESLTGGSPFLPDDDGGGGRTNNFANSDSMDRYGDHVTCFPGTERQSGEPPEKKEEPRVGWDGGARSIDSFDTDGYVRFTVNTKPTGVVAGLASRDTGGVFRDVTHGVYAHGSAIDIVESGQIVASTGVPPTDQPTIYVKREGNYVDYYVGDWHRRSDTRSSGNVFLDAALYTTNDNVDDPAISNDLSTLDSTTVYASAELELPALAMLSGEDGASSAGADLTFSPLVFDIESSLSGMNRVEVALPPLAAFSGEAPGAAAVLTAPALTLDSTSGESVPIVGGADLVMPPLDGAMRGKTGIVGSAEEAPLPALAVLTGDYPYGAASLSFGAMTAYADDGPPEGTYGVMQHMFLVDFAVTPPVFFAAIEEQLELQEAQATVVLAFQGSVFDGLMLSDDASLITILQAVIEERLAVNSSTRQGQLEAIQYAVNLATGAITTYQGFNFRGFVKVGETTYGYRSDGLYRIGPGDDAGDPVHAMVDFGVVPLARAEDDSPIAKTHLTDAFLGLGTDGEVYMKLTPDDGHERVYRVVNRPDSGRSRFGKRVTAREWRVKLEIVNATEAALGEIEYVAAVSTRRWVR